MYVLNEHCPHCCGTGWISEERDAPCPDGCAVDQLLEPERCMETHELVARHGSTAINLLLTCTQETGHDGDHYDDASLERWPRG